MENTLFPISMEMHIGFALAALLVFGLQFIRLRKYYYLVLAVAMPCSLLAYVFDNTTFFYALGIAEAAALLLAFVLSKTVDRDRDTGIEAASEESDASEKTYETGDSDIQEDSENITEIPTKPVETTEDEVPAQFVEAAAQEEAE